MLTSVPMHETAPAEALAIPTTWGRQILLTTAGMTPGEMEDQAADLLETAGELMRAAGSLRRLARQVTDAALAEIESATV